MNGLIYFAKNKINRRGYVGQTINRCRRGLDERKKIHISNGKLHPRTPFEKAINKYGPDAFEWKILDEGIDTLFSS